MVMGQYDSSVVDLISSAPFPWAMSDSCSIPYCVNESCGARPEHKLTHHDTYFLFIINAKLAI